MPRLRASKPSSVVGASHYNNEMYFSEIRSAKQDSYIGLQRACLLVLHPPCCIATESMGFPGSPLGRGARPVVHL